MRYCFRVALVVVFLLFFWFFHFRSVRSVCGCDRLWHASHAFFFSSNIFGQLNDRFFCSSFLRCVASVVPRIETVCPIKRFAVFRFWIGSMKNERKNSFIFFLSMMKFIRRQICLFIFVRIVCCSTCPHTLTQILTHTKIILHTHILRLLELSSWRFFCSSCELNYVTAMKLASMTQCNEATKANFELKNYLLNDEFHSFGQLIDFESLSLSPSSGQNRFYLLFVRGTGSNRKKSSICRWIHIVIRIICLTKHSQIMTNETEQTPSNVCRSSSEEQQKKKQLIECHQYFDVRFVFTK